MGEGNRGKEEGKNKGDDSLGCQDGWRQVQPPPGLPPAPTCPTRGTSSLVTPLNSKPSIQLPTGPTSLAYGHLRLNPCQDAQHLKCDPAQGKDSPTQALGLQTGHLPLFLSVPP